MIVLFQQISRARQGRCDEYRAQTEEEYAPGLRRGLLMKERGNHLHPGPPLHAKGNHEAQRAQQPCGQGGLRRVGKGDMHQRLQAEQAHMPPEICPGAAGLLRQKPHHQERW